MSSKKKQKKDKIIAKIFFYMKSYIYHCTRNKYKISKMKKTIRIERTRQAIQEAANKHGLGHNKTIQLRLKLSNLLSK